MSFQYAASAWSACVADVNRRTPAWARSPPPGLSVTAALSPEASRAPERVALPERDPRAVRAKHFVGLEGGLVGERAAALDVVPQIDVRHAQRACALDDRQHVVGAERPGSVRRGPSRSRSPTAPAAADRRSRRQSVDRRGCSAIPRSRMGCPGRSRPRRPPDRASPSRGSDGGEISGTAIGARPRPSAGRSRATHHPDWPSRRAAGSCSAGTTQPARGATGICGTPGTRAGRSSGRIDAIHAAAEWRTPPASAARASRSGAARSDPAGTRIETERRRKTPSVCGQSTAAVPPPCEMAELSTGGVGSASLCREIASELRRFSRMHGRHSAC